MARIGTIMSIVNGNGVITGSTERITTDVVAGWCGVDLRQPVKFVYNTARTLHIYIEKEHFMLKNVRRSMLHRTVENFLKQSAREMDNYRVI